MMATIDIAIVNVAPPDIRGTMGASIEQMTAVATAFAIAQVIVMPLTAFLGHFLGQKRVYLFCLGPFLGGSVGLAIYGQLLETYTIRAREAVLPHVNPFRPEVAQRLSEMTAAFVSRGMDPLTARASALKALNGIVASQSSMIAFEKVFMLTGFAMLVLIPLTIFLREKPHHEQEARDRGAAMATTGE